VKSRCGPGRSVIRDDEVEVAGNDRDAADSECSAPCQPPLDSSVVETTSRLPKRVLPRGRLETRRLPEKRFELRLEPMEDLIGEGAPWKVLDVSPILLLEEELRQRNAERGLIGLDDEVIAVSNAGSSASTTR
jgi:hypothetical protein